MHVCFLFSEREEVVVKSERSERGNRSNRSTSVTVDLDDESPNTSSSAKGITYNNFIQNIN